MPVRQQGVADGRSLGCKNGSECCDPAGFPLTGIDEESPGPATDEVGIGAWFEIKFGLLCFLTGKITIALSGNRVRAQGDGRGCFFSLLTLQRELSQAYLLV